jgi:RNA polymerase sigma-70 factor, ECF subfamily
MGQAQALAIQPFVRARKGTGTMTKLAVDPPEGSASGTVEPHTPEQDWESLIRRVAQGDQQALGAFYDATSSMVYGLALRILGNAATAEEVTLDVYTQVWRQAAVYNAQRGTPSAWLFMLTRSRAIDLLRSHVQEQKHIASLDVAEPYTASFTPEESSVVTERRRLVQAAFASLAPEQRAVLELAYFSGLSHGEIAAKLGLPLGTVKTRIRLGMARLRELLQPLLE